VTSASGDAVSVLLNDFNVQPEAVADSYYTNEDTPLNVFGPSGVLSNDSDFNNDPFTATVTDNTDHGALALNPNGSFSYTPAPNYNGADSFTYRICDNGVPVKCDEATVNLTVAPVNDAPVAIDDAYSTDEDTLLVVSAPGVLGNDTDVDGDDLDAAVVTVPDHGELTMNPNGAFTYTPDANYNGSDSFTYTVSDGNGGSDLATVNLTVFPVADEPVAVDDSYNTNEDTTLNISAANGVLRNDTDADNDTLSASVVSVPDHGALVLNADGSFTYTPDANFNGTDSFTYRASDGNGGSDVATVTLTVASVNDTPVAVDDAYDTNEDTLLVVPAPGVLGNDTDVDGDDLDAAVVNAPTHGQLVLNPNGSFTYTPDANYNGSDSFTYTAYDGMANSAPATVSLTVDSVNDTPVAVDDSYNTNEDAPFNVSAANGVLKNDTDVENDTLSAWVESEPIHGTLVLNADGAFTYTPDANFNGTDSFTYRASDGKGDSDVATVTSRSSPSTTHPWPWTTSKPPKKTPPKT
jgi:VCBS repeat-containing protein